MGAHKASNDKARTRVPQDRPGMASGGFPAPAPQAGACRECGRHFRLTDIQQEFCSPTCRTAWRSRALSRGAKLYEAVMTWRVLRRPGSFQAVTALVSDFLEEDRAAGRRWRPRTFNPNTGRRERRK